MRKYGILTLLAAVIVLGVVAAVPAFRDVVWGFLGGEPFQDGRPLRYWLRALRTGDAAERERAAHALGELGPASDDVVPALAEALGDESYIVRRNIEVIEGMGVKVGEIRSLGGGARSRVWKQIEADVTGRPVVTTTNEEAATLGAAILAGKAVGMFRSVEEAAAEMVQIKERFEPTPGNIPVYDDSFRTYVQLYDALCPLFERHGA